MSDPNREIPSPSNPAHPERCIATEREILELRIEVELQKAKAELDKENRRHVRKLAEQHFGPKVRFWQKATVYSVLGLVGVTAWSLFGLKRKIQTEADVIISKRLIDPQLSNSVNEAITIGAMPLIEKRISPLQQSNLILSLDLEKQRNENLHLRSTVAAVESNVSAAIPDWKAFHSAFFPFAFQNAEESTKRLSVFAGTELDLIYATDDNTAHSDAGVIGSLLAGAKWKINWLYRTNLPLRGFRVEIKNFPGGTNISAQTEQMVRTAKALCKELSQSGMNVIFPGITIGGPLQTNLPPMRLTLTIAPRFPLREEVQMRRHNQEE